VGEDYSFCVRARRAGFKVWVDPTVKVKHHKDTIYVVE
jgi:GT2 family glycosyltransferase